jgi:hypothetical protein
VWQRTHIGGAPTFTLRSPAAAGHGGQGADEPGSSKINLQDAHIREDQADLDGKASALVAHSAQQRVHPGFVRHNLRAREPVLGAQEIESLRPLA